MMYLLKSASKFVFVFMACAVIAGLFTGHISEDNFMILAGSAFAFYFSNKPTDSKGVITK